MVLNYILLGFVMSNIFSKTEEIKCLIRHKKDNIHKDIMKFMYFEKCKDTIR